MKEGKVFSFSRAKVETPINERPITVALIGSWGDCKAIFDEFKIMSQDNNGRWGRIQAVNPDEYPSDKIDYYVIFNKPPVYVYFNPDFFNKTILCHMEPYIERRPELWGKEWALVNKSKFLDVWTHAPGSFNNLQWHLSLTYSELKKTRIEKTIHDRVSVILSTKYSDPGHIKRIDFVNYLIRKGEVNIDAYGDCDAYFSSNREKKRYSHKGKLPTREKDAGLLPYKYTFNAENTDVVNYTTEKFVDAILSECLIFYWGNLGWHTELGLPKECCVQLSLTNLEEDHQTVKRAIEEDWHSQRLPFIRQAKEMLLDQHQFFPRLEKRLTNK